MLELGLEEYVRVQQKEEKGNGLEEMAGAQNPCWGVGSVNCVPEEKSHLRLESLRAGVGCSGVTALEGRCWAELVTIQGQCDITVLYCCVLCPPPFLPFLPPLGK